ncbi:MAG: dihydropteroate synthase [Microthrixaceae bacterium]|nr:dihydropteroate synthase [Microthrixaceae bacterium]MCB1012479.1 dihydropteroate synthase [Microthrixaceae bacterium]MCO5321225.1 dihydropteroate synthase [Microthrixaceae bacterium]
MTVDHRGGDRAGGRQAVSVMGILNITPDSFSDGGLHQGVDRALRRALTMASEGAAVIDVGGESTRPGAAAVDPVSETARVLPVIEAMAGHPELSGVRISVDTRNESTARAAVAAGATLINDVSASLWPVAAETGVGWVAMHMSGDPRTMQREPSYDDVVSEVREFLVERATTAERAGVPEIWVDPGIGFGKTTEHNLALLRNIDTLAAEGFPVLVGTSRKRFLGELTALSDRSGGLPQGAEATTDVHDRIEGSLVSALWAIIGGARAIRAHDVGATVVATETLFRGGRQGPSGHLRAP